LRALTGALTGALTRRFDKSERKGRSEGDEYYTPGHVIEKVKRVMGCIDLDPASCFLAQKTVKAKRYYDIETDGLKQNWHGKVFLNPPYSQTRAFVDKLLTEKGVTEAITLTLNKSETIYGQTLLENADVICFWRRPIIMIGNNALGFWGHMLCYFGPNKATFVKVFEDCGMPMSPIRKPKIH
jgi:ParB family transcriptional regulator, chromosome partitioning protein